MRLQRLEYGVRNYDSASRLPMVNSKLIQLDGGKIWCGVFGTGSGTPLLVVHGIPGSNSRYLQVLASLGDDRPVILYDQLGGGRSDRPHDTTMWTVERFVDELASVRDALDLQAVHILGHSWGGMLALEHARTGVQGIKSLVLSSVPISIPRYVEDIRRLRSELPPAIVETLDRHERAGTTLSGEYQAALTAFRQRHTFCGAAWPTEFLELLADINPEVFVAVWGPDPFDCTGVVRDYGRRDPVPGSHPPVLATYFPVLVTVGAQDATTVEAAEEYTRAIPDARLHVFQQSAHMAMLEEPDAYLAVVRTFLRRVDAGA